MNFKEEIFKSIQTMVDRAIANCKVDCTYRTVIKRVDKNGYVIIDQSGSERMVPCCMPNVGLSAGQMVWVKIPCGNIKWIHICGVV